MKVHSFFSEQRHLRAFHIKYKQQKTIDSNVDDDGLFLNVCLFFFLVVGDVYMLLSFSKISSMMMIIELADTHTHNENAIPSHQ